MVDFPTYALIVNDTDWAGKVKMRSAVMVWISAVSLLFVGCQPQSVAINDDNRLIYGLTLSPSGFDPHINESAEMGIVLRQVYDTLVYRDPSTGVFVPGLAAEWMISDDGLEYTFLLKENVTFHDGTPFNSQAVAANLDRIADPTTRSQRAILLLGPYAGYEILDEFRILIRLTEPFSPLLDGLSQVYLGIASPAALNAQARERYQFHQVGTGPFELVEYIPDTRLVIRRNNSYTWGPDFYNPPQQNAVQTVEFRFFRDPSTRLINLESNDAHIMGELSPLDARTLTGNSQIQLIPATIGGQPLQFLMNTQQFPTDNVTIRRALIYGTSRDQIVNTVYQGFSPIAWSPLTRSTEFYDRSLENAYAYDLTQARALISSQGYVDEDGDGFWDTDDGPLTVTIIVPPWGLISDVAQLLSEQWTQMGVAADLQAVADFPSVIAAVESGEYNLVAFNAFGLDPGPILQSYFTSGGTRNWTLFNDPQLDATLNTAVATVDPLVRTNLYASAQLTIMDQALILPIRDYVNLNAAVSSVGNLTFDAYGWFPLLTNVTFTP